MASYDWSEIKTKYETGKYSIADLADEYGFSESYGYRKARENNWEKGASAEEVQKQAAKKAFEEEVNKEANLRKDYDELLERMKVALTAEVFESLDRNDTPDFTLLKSFKITTEIIHNLRKEQWEVNEILETADKVLDDNQDEKLEQFIDAVNNMDVEE